MFSSYCHLQVAPFTALQLGGREGGGREGGGREGGRREGRIDPGKEAVYEAAGQEGGRHQTPGRSCNRADGGEMY